MDFFSLSPDEWNAVGLSVKVAAVAMVASLPVAIAVALLASAGEPLSGLLDCLFLGEVALDGALRAVPGVLPIILEARPRGSRRAGPAGRARNHAWSA